MNRRAFLASGLALSAPSSIAAPPRREPEVILCGDSHAYVLAPAFRAEAKKHGVPVDVVAHGGSSVRQWLRKKWMQREVLSKFPKAQEILISLGTNCTRVERPLIVHDIDELVMIVNDWHYDTSDDEEIFRGASPVWLLPPPLKMDTKYLRDAVDTCEVFAFEPGKLPLEIDGIHPTHAGCEAWARKIAEVLWE